ARVIHIKLRLQQEFPVSFTEVLSPSSSVLPALPTYSKALAGVTASNFSAEEQAAACLLMALSQDRGGTVLNPEDLGSAAIGQKTDGSKPIRFLVDAWGKPLFFIRFPTGDTNLNPDPNNGQAGINDPEDPEALLTNPSWGTAGRNNFTTLHKPPPAA